MSVFYMKHPKHGTKVAIQEEEVEHDKKRGWVEYDPNEKPESKTITLSGSKEGKSVQAQA